MQYANGESLKVCGGFVKIVCGVCLFVSYLLLLRAELGVCVVPVADLLGDPLSGKSLKAVERAYQALPMDGTPQLVKRIGQLLFNDVVTIVKEHAYQVCIRVPRQFYCTADNGTPHQLYWTLKKYIRPLACLQDISGIPSRDKDSSVSTLTLKRPWYDVIHSRWYSMGTRFVINEKKTAHRHCFAVYTLAPRGRQSTIHIPREHCVQTDALTYDEQRALFVEILKELAHVDGGIVPYVWGGISFLVPYGTLFTQEEFELSGKTHATQLTTYRSHKGPYAGFDCTALVLRAAQVAGLPLFARNSWAMKRYVRSLRTGEQPEEGDIIYIPGHVLVLSDIKNGLIVEARSQSSGYGFVHEIPLSEQFDGITCVQDLLAAYHAQRKVRRLDKNGTVIASVPLSILKLRSIRETSSKKFD